MTYRDADVQALKAQIELLQAENAKLRKPSWWQRLKNWFRRPEPVLDEELAQGTLYISTSPQTDTAPGDYHPIRNYPEECAHDLSRRLSCKDFIHERCACGVRMLSTALHDWWEVSEQHMHWSDCAGCQAHAKRLKELRLQREKDFTKDAEAFLKVDA